MASFSQQEIAEQALDWDILRSGGITLYKNLDFMSLDARLLLDKGYRIVNADCSRWSSIDAMHDGLADALAFPDYYGRNLNALDECLVDLDIPDPGGLLLQLIAFDATQTGTIMIREGAIAVLDIAARAIREHMLTGRRFIVFVHTNDPNTAYDNLGCICSSWNRREWLRAKRT